MILYVHDFYRVEGVRADHFTCDKLIFDLRVDDS